MIRLWLPLPEDSAWTTLVPCVRNSALLSAHDLVLCLLFLTMYDLIPTLFYLKILIEVYKVKILANFYSDRS